MKRCRRGGAGGAASSSPGAADGDGGGGDASSCAAASSSSSSSPGWRSDPNPSHSAEHWVSESTDGTGLRPRSGSRLQTRSLILMS